MSERIEWNRTWKLSFHDKWNKMDVNVFRNAMANKFCTIGVSLPPSAGRYLNAYLVHVLVML